MQPPLSPSFQPSAPVPALGDEEIVRRVKDGETPLFELLMRRHNQRVYRTVRSILRDEAEVEDVMQESYLSAFENLAGFRGTSSFATWLTRIAVNEAIGRARRARRLKLVGDDTDTNQEQTMISAKGSPEERAGARELLAFVERAVDELPELYRTVFVLREVERMSTRETASVIGSSEDVVKTRLTRAWAMLETKLPEATGARLEALFGFHATRCDRVVVGVMQRIGERH